MAEHSGSSVTADVAVIGGGIIGSAIGLRLAQSGLKVAVIDRGRQPGSEASGAAAGMLAPQGEMTEAGAFFELCKASHELYPSFVAEVEELSQQPVDYWREGTLIVALDDAECEELEHIHAIQNRLGLPLERLNGKDVLRHVPGLSPHIKLGLRINGDHWVDNERLSHALVNAAERSGVQFHWDCTAKSFEVKGACLEAVQAISGIDNSTLKLSSGKFVLAAGCWSGQLASGLGISIPVEPCRGQIIEFETGFRLQCVVRAGKHYLLPRSQQRMLAGTTSEYVGFEKAVTAQGLQSIIEGVSRIVPSAGNFHFRRAWAGLRPDTRDHLPILGYGSLKNLVFATGHFRNGILLAPKTAKLIAELVETGSSSFPLEPYSPNRFAALY